MHSRAREQGETIINLLVTLGLASIILTTGILNLRQLGRSSKDAGRELADFLNRSRGVAIESMTTWQLVATDSGTVRAFPVKGCNGTPLQTRPSLTFSMPKGYVLSIANLNYCISPQGLPAISEDLNISVIAEGQSGNARIVQVPLSGVASVRK